MKIPSFHISPAQEAELDKLLDKHELSDNRDIIFELARNAIRFKPARGCEAEIGGTRLGGLPDVPPDWTWPENLEFLAQFNLSEIAPYDVNSVLPPRGLLSFYTGNIWAGEIEHYQVDFYEGDFSLLKRAGAPENYDIIGRDSPNGNRSIVYAPIAVKPFDYISLPDGYTLYSQYNVSGEIWSRVDALKEEIRNAADEVDSRYHPFGEYQLLGRYDEGQNSEDWTVFFQMDSNDEIGTMFSDAGTIYYMIHRDDIAIRRFDNLHFTMTCG